MWAQGQLLLPFKDNAFGLRQNLLALDREGNARHSRGRPAGVNRESSRSAKPLPLR